MAIYKLSVPLVITASLAACAQAPQSANTIHGEEYVCYTEVRTGSHFPRKTCRFTARESAERDEAQDALERATNENAIGNREFEVDRPAINQNSIPEL